jgi:TolA-binding protein
LIIFSMGVGTSNIAANVAASPNGHAALERAVAVAESFPTIVTGTANAQEPTRTRPTTPSASRSAASEKVKELEEKHQALLKEIEQLRHQNQALQQQTASVPEEKLSSEPAHAQKGYEQQGFFKKW